MTGKFKTNWFIDEYRIEYIVQKDKYFCKIKYEKRAK